MHSASVLVCAIGLSAGLLGTRAHAQGGQLHVSLQAGLPPAHCMTASSQHHAQQLSLGPVQACEHDIAQLVVRATVVGELVDDHSASARVAQEKRDVAQELASRGLQIVGESAVMPMWVVEGELGVVRQLVCTQHGVPGVAWVEPPLPALGELNAEAREMVSVNTLHALPYGLSGAGVRVMVWDGGRVDSGHPDLQGRVTLGDANTRNDHATHVAGTLAGSGMSEGGGIFSEKGMAPEAQLYSFGVADSAFGVPLHTNPLDLEADYTRAFDIFDVDIANNSVGANVALFHDCAYTGDYGATSALIDTLVHNGIGGSPVRAVFAAGNERQTTRCGSSYNTTAPPATSKNPIIVGAVDTDTAQVTTFTSWGPTDDGRLRPDVVAPGCQVLGDGGIRSLALFSGYAIECGTSMAAPVVTGVGALLLEDWRAQFPMRADLSNAAIKATLVHTAVDIHEVGPDFRSGHGLIDAAAAVDALRAGELTQGEVTHRGWDEMQVVVPQGTAAFQATLVWDDAPATPGSATALVNDLDLEVFAPNGARWWPWTLNTQSPWAGAQRNGRDNLNNVERVTVNAPMAGTWTVRIYGENVPQGPQPYALLVTPSPVVERLEVLDLAPQTLFPGEVGVVRVAVTSAEPLGVGDVRLLSRLQGETAYDTLAMIHEGDGVYRNGFFAGPCLSATEYAVEVPSLGMRVPETGWYTSGVADVIVHFDDDAETDQGWSYSAPSDTATSGLWERGDPDQTSDFAIAQPEDDVSLDGAMCFVTGAAGGIAAGVHDVDGGKATLTSPVVDLQGEANAQLSYWLWYSNHAGSGPLADVMRVELTNDGGVTWRPVEQLGPTGERVEGGWHRVSVPVRTIIDVTQPNWDQVQLRFVVEDAALPSLVEAAVDEVMFVTNRCALNSCTGDASRDGVVDIFDMLTVLNGVGQAPQPTTDLNADATVDQSDMQVVEENFGSVCETPGGSES